MAKAKTSNKKVAKSGGRLASLKAWGKKHKVITSLLVIALLFGVYYGVRASYEWTQFKLAERKVDSLYALTIEKLGEPNYKNIEGTCGHASAKFHKGDLSCRYSFVLVFKPGSLKSIKDIHDKVALIAKDYGGIKDPDYSKDNPPQTQNEQYYDLKSRLSTTCAVNIYETGQSVATRYGDSHSLVDFGQVTVVSGVCYGGPLIKSIYPELD